MGWSQSTAHHTDRRSIRPPARLPSFTGVPWSGPAARGVCYRQGDSLALYSDLRRKQRCKYGAIINTPQLRILSVRSLRAVTVRSGSDSAVSAFDSTPVPSCTYIRGSSPCPVYVYAKLVSIVRRYCPALVRTRCEAECGQLNRCMHPS